MSDLQLKQLSLRSKNGAIIKISSDWCRIERGRHHNDTKIPPRALELLQKRQRELAVQVTLLELVQNDSADASG